MKKLFNSIWFYVSLSFIISLVILVIFVNKDLEKMGGAHEVHDAPAPMGPVKYPGKLTEELKEFVATLEKRDAEIREREEAVDAYRDSLRQEKEEFDVLKAEVTNLQDQFDKKAADFRTKRIFLEKAEQLKMVDLTKTVESLSPSAAVALFLQMNKANPENFANPTITGILNLMDPKDIAPIFEEMTDGKQASEESKSLASILAQQLRRLVVEESPATTGNPSGG
jgi:flagellar motility protein MotE (MotC chaperone)